MDWPKRGPPRDVRNCFGSLVNRGGWEAWEDTDFTDEHGFCNLDKAMKKALC